MAAAIPIILGPILWTPALLETYLWLDADDSKTITLNAGNVSRWNDKSGNGNDAVQTAAAAQPLYRPVGLNGLGAVSFVGDQMSITTWNTANSDWSVVALFKATEAAPATADSAFGSSGAGTGTWQVEFRSSLVGLSGTNDAGSNVNAPTSGSLMNPYQTTSSIVAGITSEVGSTKTYGNGTLNVNYAGSFRAGTTAFKLGVSRSNIAYLNHDMGEIVAAKRVFSTDERQRLEGYLAWKWGTAQDLPATHPYKNGPPYA